MKIIGHFETTKGFEHWKKAFDAHEPARNAVGMTTLFYGVQADNQEIIYVCLNVESMDKLQQFMSDPKNAEVIQEAGVKLETQVMTPIIPKYECC